MRQLVSSKREPILDVGQAGGVVEPGSRGLRGVLDNIVNDGMRMAVEMRKRMDEAQREFEQQRREENKGKGRASMGEDDDEDSEGEEAGADLLEGAEVTSIRTKGSEGGLSRSVTNVGDVTVLDVGKEKSVEFEQ